MTCRYWAAFYAYLLLPAMVFCQVPQKSFDPGALPASYFADLKKSYGDKKTYPPQMERQVLIALSFYPELANIPIKFQLRSIHSSGHTRVTWAGLFESPRNRHFVVVVSDSTEDMLMPLIFKNISFDAQIGLIGHELAHVVDGVRSSTFEILKHVIRSISAKYVDRAEAHTDATCIDHGLGYQLLAWSMTVRMKMNTVNWGGPDYVHKNKERKRYMNPDEILKRMEQSPLYDRAR